jgi:hypothetical protein
VIKLKDILTESTKVELHKVITDKTEPAFMTEEQWQKKWDSKQPLTEGVIDNYLKKHIYKFIAGTYVFHIPREKEQVALIQKYLYTGNITKAESKILYKYFNKTLWARGGALAALLVAFIGLFPAAAVAVIIGTIVKKYGARWLTPSPDNNFITPAEARDYKWMDGKDWSLKSLQLAAQASNELEAKLYKAVDKKGYAWFMGLDKDVKKAGTDIQNKLM